MREVSDYYIAAAQRHGVDANECDAGFSDFDNQPSWEVPDIVFTARPFKNDLLEVEWEKLQKDKGCGPPPVLIPHRHGQEAVWLDYTLPRYISWRLGQAGCIIDRHYRYDTIGNGRITIENFPVAR